MPNATEILKRTRGSVQKRMAAVNSVPTGPWFATISKTNIREINEGEYVTAALSVALEKPTDGTVVSPDVIVEISPVRYEVFLGRANDEEKIWAIAEALTGKTYPDDAQLETALKDINGKKVKASLVANPRAETNEKAPKFIIDGITKR